MKKNAGDSILHRDTRLGYVHLTVSDLERALVFYQRSLGFQIHRQEGDAAFLGAGRDDLLVLTEQPGAVRVPRTTGLYHFAILVPSRLELARVLRNLINTETALDGGADHMVSEALYLSDPDGNGIEIYRDRPRSDWEYVSGTLKMGTDPLDYDGILAELKNDFGAWAGLPPDTILGHMHLHVADIPEAEEFYANIIGFDVMVRYHTNASFLSAGGYHHHLGINTWNGVGAPPPPPDAVGLRYFVVQLPSNEEKEKLITRLETANISFEKRADGLFVRDPSQNGLVFSVREV
jgi:catechol 2,3-dioxygenase